MTKPPPYLIRTILLTLLIFCTINVSSIGIPAPGYIIKNNKDTVSGYVQLSHFDQVNGGLKLTGIENESFHSRVVFKAHGESSFQTYFPEMILGFGFIYKSTEYVFEQAFIKKKSIFKSERQQCRFLRVIFVEDSTSLFKNMEFVPNPGLTGNQDKYLKYNTHIFRIKKSKTVKPEDKSSTKNYNLLSKSSMDFKDKGHEY